MRVIKKPGRKEPEIKVEVAGKIVITITKSKGLLQSLKVDADPRELQLKGWYRNKVFIVFLFTVLYWNIFICMRESNGFLSNILLLLF